MKFETPPLISELDFNKYFELIKDSEILEYLIKSDKRYFYWSEIKHRKDSPFKDSLQEWYATKIYRKLASNLLIFKTHKFTYNITESIQADLHDFDLKLVGSFFHDSISSDQREEFFSSSLLEEAIASSQIEGAATTTEVAKKLIKSGRKARNESEQMIINNWQAIQEIEIRLDESLNINLILDIHKIMTAKTSAEIHANKLRKNSVFVVDHVDGEIAFEAPNFNDVEYLMKRLIFFINDDETFVHPIIKASILHFLIGYIHPFGDGNGRTARALFYWYLIKKGYSLLKHISISKAILESRKSYDKAFLKTEHDENDMTYFILYSIKSLRVAFQSLVSFRDKKFAEKVEMSAIKNKLLDSGFNIRQANILGNFYIHPNSSINISEFARKYDVVRQTASRDLKELVKKKLLRQFKDGKYTSYQLISKNLIEEFLIH